MNVLYAVIVFGYLIIGYIGLSLWSYYEDEINEFVKRHRR